MLVIKPFVNYTPMEEEQEIWVQNHKWCRNGIYEYRIRKPEGYDHHKIYHKRRDSWMILMERVLEVLNNG